LREIDGFYGCTSLSRIEIPSSVEVIGSNGFTECRSLTTVIFASESHLIERGGFRDCPSLHVVIIRAGCRLRRKEGLQNVRAFVISEDEYENKKPSRREVHLGIGGRKVWDDILDNFS
jgi:hypothetical protein